MENTKKANSISDAEQALRESEARLRRQNALFEVLMDNLTSGVFMVEAPSGKPLLANKAACRLLGRGILPDTNEKNIGEVDRASRLGSGDPYPAAQMPIIRGMFGEASYIDDMVVARPDGTETLLEVFGSPIRDEKGTVWASLVCFNDITERKRTQDELQKQLSEKELLLREIHHRVKNNIASIQALLSLQAGASSNVEVKSALQNAVARVESMRALYERLLVANEFDVVPMIAYINSLIDSMRNFYVMDSSVEIQRNLADFSLLARTAVPLGIIVNELITNVFKYAFPERTGGTVSITLEKHNSVVTLTVQDDGIGFVGSEHSDANHGFGLTIVNMLVTQLKGRMIRTNEGGAKTVIEFTV